MKFGTDLYIFTLPNGGVFLATKKKGKRIANGTQKRPARGSSRWPSMR